MRLILPLLMILTFVAPESCWTWCLSTAMAEVTDQRVEQSLDRGVRYLLAQQRADGSWPEEHPSYPAGTTLLSTLALLNAGMTIEDDPIRKAINFVQSIRPLERTYTVALETIVYSTADPQKYGGAIQQNVGWLQQAQRSGIAGPNSGGWGYGREGLDADESNSQFALLALYEADRVNITALDTTWRLALAYWKRAQTDLGGFRYRTNRPTGSMTCAGIGSLIIASGHVTKLDADVRDGQVLCCTSTTDDQADIEQAITWLGENFSVRRNPIRDGSAGGPALYYYYYMYALERVGRLAGRRFIGDHDWYREGSEALIERQDPLTAAWNRDDPVVCTAFSVLFLSKGRRPVLISTLKRKPESDWNRHRHATAHLTTHVETRWQQKMTWQVVDIANASANDLLRSPVIFLSGSDGLQFTELEKVALRDYVQAGGFLFVENCCGGAAFDRDFKNLVAELFPDSSLRLLPPDHPVWFAEQRVDPQFVRPIYGVEACCRTGIMYCPETAEHKSLSCLWELAVPRRGKDDLPAEVQARVESALAVGANVLTYATGRELRGKLDDIELVPRADESVPLEPGRFYIAKLQHRGGSDDAPTALSNAVALVGQQTQLPVATEKRLIAPTDPQLPDYPVVFLHGRRQFSWNANERKTLRSFVENGGVILADSICASEEFTTSLRNELRAIFPDRQLRPIPAQHPMFTPRFFGFDVTTVTLREPKSRVRADDRLAVRRERIAPQLEGIEIDGRFAVIFSPLDLSCALENQPSLECRGYEKEDAARLMTNMVLYAMQQ